MREGAKTPEHAIQGQPRDFRDHLLQDRCVASPPASQFNPPCYSFEV